MGRFALLTNLVFSLALLASGCINTNNISYTSIGATVSAKTESNSSSGGSGSGLAAPLITGSTPLSPSNGSFNPTIFGTAPATAVTVEIHDNATCTNMVNSGSKALFESGGISVAATANGSKQFWARAFDGTIFGACSTAPLTYVHDNLPPNVINVTASDPNGLYGIGSVIHISVQFSEVVYVSGGTPSLTMAGGLGSSAGWINGSGTNTLNFEYTVIDGDSHADMETGATWSANGATVADGLGNAASFSLPAAGAAVDSLSDNKNIVIDGIRPTGSITAPPLSNGTSVIFSLSAAGSPEIYLTEVSDCTSGGSWATWDPSPSFSPASYGLGKTMYVKFRDAAMNESATCYASNSYDYEAVSSQPLFGTNGANWNDYVTRADLLPFWLKADVACSGGEAAFPNCMHGGELRKVMIPGCNSCANIVVTDTLGAFRWICDDAGGTQATVYSSGLVPGKGLKDLLNTTSNTWNSIGVTVNNACAAGPLQSIPRAWWSNTIASLPANGGGVVQNLAASGTIYTLDASAESAGYNLNADRIALVTKPGAILSYDGNASSNCNQATGETATADARCLISVGANKFTWIEGQFSGKPTAGSMAQKGIQFSGITTNFNRIDGAAIQDVASVGLSILGAKKNYIHDLTVSKVGSSTADKLVENSSNAALNIFYGLRLSQAMSGAKGFFLAGAGTGDNVVANLFLSGSEGFSLSNGKNVLVGATILNSTSNGISSAGPYLKNDIHSVLIANSGLHGMTLGSAAGATEVTVSQLVSAHNSNSGLYLDQSSGKFSGSIMLGNNTSANCTVIGGGAPNGMNGSCTPMGSSDGTVQSTALSLTSVFKGAVASDDTANISDTNGSATYASIADWTSFSNPFRMWGKDVAFGPTLQGACSSANCRIWDWSIAAAASQVLNKSWVGTTDNPVFTPDSTCPSQLDGNEVITDQYTSPRTYLKVAVEVIGDFFGNDNGLCETGEICLYTPNFGAYQGHGNPMNTCNFSDGTVSSVRIYAFPNNGM